MKVKRVTDPLDDEAKARLVGFSYSSTTSGSEHGGIYDDNSDSPCLSDLLQSFYEDYDDHGINESHVKSERIDFVSDDVEQQQQLDDAKNVIDYEVKSTFSNSNCSDMYENLLRFHVLKAIDVFTCLKSNRVMFRRNVMCYLRNVGYDAAICKSKWESSGGLTAGNYEYIDVVATATSSTAVRNRYIIDIDFAAQFEIARQTEQYSREIQALPRFYIGRDEELKRVVKTMCDAARRSLKINELHFPPWRKNRYMMMKWFGPYRRSTNLIPANVTMKLPVVVQASVKCQCVGFDTDVNRRNFIHTR